MLAYSPKIAAETKERRRERLQKADAWIRVAQDKLVHPCKIRCSLDSKSDLNWTLNPVHTGHLIRFYLDTLSENSDSVSRYFRTKKS